MKTNKPATKFLSPREERETRERIGKAIEKKLPREKGEETLTAKYTLRYIDLTYFQFYCGEKIIAEEFIEREGSEAEKEFQTKLFYAKMMTADLKGEIINEKP